MLVKALVPEDVDKFMITPEEFEPT